MARLPAVFDSGFCFVTGAFRFSGADFAAALDDDLTFDAVALAAVLGAAFAALAVAALLGAFARPVGWTKAFFCTAGLAADLLAAVLATADFRFFPVEVVFAGFFIAFAWNQYQLWIALVARMGPAHVEPTKTTYSLHGIRPRDIPETLPVEFNSANEFL
jgi:hypothetical protein